MAAARRGVKVTILLQGRVEYLLLHYASQALYGSLLAADVRIQEYRRSFLHAKVAVIDGHWATVGSSNIDPFSLLLAREANVVVNDSAFAAELVASLRLAMQEGAWEVKRDDWGKKSLPARIKLAGLLAGAINDWTGGLRQGTLTPARRSNLYDRRTGRALGRDDAGIHPGPVQAAEQPRMFDLDAAIHHHLKPGR